MSAVGMAEKVEKKIGGALTKRPAWNKGQYQKVEKEGVGRG